METTTPSAIAIYGGFCPSNLKQLLLLFDKIGIIRYESLIHVLRWLAELGNLRGDLKTSDFFNGVANDVEFLAANNLVFDPGPIRKIQNSDQEVRLAAKAALEVDDILANVNAELDQLTKYAERPPKRKTSSRTVPKEVTHRYSTKLSEALSLKDSQHYFLARYLAVQLNRSNICEREGTI